MNPLFKLITGIIIALEISIIPSIQLNCALIALCLLLLVIQGPSPKFWFYLILAPFIPALGSFWAQFMYGSSIFAWVMFTRIYAYVTLSATLTTSISENQLVESLEQNLHLPNKLIFGILGGFKMFPQISRQIKIIRAAASMRGIRLPFWSPKLYFRAILAAVKWSNQIIEAMSTHGFVADQPRTHYRQISITVTDWLKMLMILIGIQFFVQK